MKFIVYICIAFVLSGVAVMAQGETCPDIVAQAVSVTAAECEGLGRNQACYGNVAIEAQFREGMGDLSFQQAGDVIDVTAIDTMNLSAMQSPDEWGVALFSIQANIPDTVPGQNVTLLLFGDVAIENMGEAQPPSIEITLGGNANVRSGPGSGYGVIDGLVRDTSVVAIGRNEFGDWLQVQLPEERGTGWIYGSSVVTDGDLMTLDVIDPQFTDEEGTEFGAMEAFFFRNGVVEPQCNEAPQDGILVQTPAGLAEVTLLVNEVQIDLGSTIFMQAVPGDVMTVTLLEGTASVTAQGVTLSIPAGAQAKIPLDANGIANGIPEIVTYDDALTQALPIEILPEEIEVVEALTDEELDEIVNTVILTQWMSINTPPNYVCANRLNIDNSAGDGVVNIPRIGNTIFIDEVPLELIPGNSLQVTREQSTAASDGSTVGFVYVRNYTVVSSNEILGEIDTTVTFDDRVLCQYIKIETVTYLGEAPQDDSE